MKFTGIVKKHLGRGKQLGFPTANLEAPTELEDSLYLAWTEVEPGKPLPSLAFIGNNQTFDEEERIAEVHILNFDQDIYGKQIEVEIIQRLRPVIKFSSARMLTQQMHNDVTEAKRFFKSQAKVI
jgi:riboflavin kinase / FMN adenylyltransferase